MDFNVGRVAVISHNYNVVNCYGHKDFAEHFHQINRVCDEKGCDTILYPLFTWDENSTVERDYGTIFANLTSVRCIIIEIGSMESKNKVVEVWLRDEDSPRILQQCFGKSKEPCECKERFIRDIPQRIIGNSLLMICGESNIVTLVRKDGSFNDPFGFNQAFDSPGPKIILNPLHDYMSRYEMRLKRRYFSRNGRTVISVWNQGKKKGEARLPWTLFVDGDERTHEIQEIPSPIAPRPDIRIGIVPEQDLGNGHPKDHFWR